METRASHILIGAFTLLGFLGILGFFVLFSKTQLDRQFAYYDVMFDNVAGLDQASDVRFAGVIVGQVVDISLSGASGGAVRVRLEVQADTPVRTDSVATIEAQGVTGVSYVAISAGSADAPLLRRANGPEIPRIEAGRSVLQSLSADAPALLSETLDAVKNINAMLTEENRQRIETILANLERSSGKLDETLGQFSEVAANVGDSVSEIAGFTQELEGISQAVNSTLDLAEGAITAITEFSTKAEVTLQAGTATLDSARETMELAGSFIDTDLRSAVAELKETSATLRQQSGRLGGRAAELLDVWSDTGRSATARLVEAEALLADTDAMVANLDKTLASMDSAAGSFETLVTGDGAALVARATRAVDTITATVENDLPAILADISSATETAKTTITTVAEDLSDASGRIEGLSATAETTLATVTDTFARANDTLAAIDSALAKGERTLSAAQSAFAGADRLIREDISAITADLQQAIGRLDAALARVSTDLPVLSQDLRDAASAAQTAFSDLSGMVGGAKTPVNDFLDAGLPQYTRLAAETRDLIATLETLAQRIERDPARFFLGNDVPEYRR